MHLCPDIHPPPPPSPKESASEREQPDIYSVVGVGKEYIQRLTQSMTSLFYLTPLDHLDQKYLHAIVDGKGISRLYRELQIIIRK